MGHPHPRERRRESQGLSRLWIRSALAPRSWSSRWALGAAGIAVVAAVEALVGPNPALGSALAAVAVVVGLTGGRGDAIAVALACVVAAVVSGVWDGWEATWTVTLVTVAASSIAAVLASLLRATAITTARQLELLHGLARLATGTRTVREIAEAVLDLLVPAYADVSMLDLAIPGYERRIGVRVAGPRRDLAEEWLRRRPPIHPHLPGAQRAIATGIPALVEELDDELLQEIAADEADLAELRRTGARSLLLLPLATRGAPFGALSLIAGSSGRRYARSDLDFCQLVQGRISIVLDNAGLSRAAARSERLMTAALDTLEEAVTMNGPDGATVYVNHAAVRLLNAQSADEVLNGKPGAIMQRFLVYDEAGDPVSLQDFPAFRALAGEDHPEPLLVRNVVRATGEERWLLNKVSVLRDADGEVDRIVNVIEDVTQVKQAEVRQRLLGEATRILSASEDEARAVERLARVLVPEFVDCCAIDLVADDGTLEPAAVVHADPALVDEARATHAGHPVERALVDGATQRASTEGGAVIVVPLMGAGSPLGAITLIRKDPVRGFLDEEVLLAEELGNRASLALLNARLSTERATITRELQEGLRPPALPAVPGLQTATLYRPAGELNDVGGDFYDALHTAGGWTVCIGDVAGQGARAAALMAVARFTLRSGIQHTGDPEQAVAAVSRALSEQSDMALCTLAVLRLRRASDGSVALDSLSAGHPLPILIRDGAARELGAPGPIAGVFDDPSWEVTTASLLDGDTVLLYTDGVLDTVGSDGRFGEQRLLALLDGAPADPHGLVARIDDALAAFQDGPQRDDTAIVAVTVRDAAAFAAAMGEAHATA
jgi:serine phosphatase RsbU (regulator of sigma subunit)/PAS domain-containing protein